MGDVVQLRRHARASTRLKPNTARSALLPRRANSSAKIGKYMAGILPEARQLLVAGKVTPASSAAAIEPPTASRTSSTDEQSMPIDSSSVLNLSRVQSPEIDSSINLKSNAVMPADNRDQVAFRLRLLPAALGLPTKNVYAATDLSKSGWSNVASPNQTDRITVDAALDLWEAFGVTVEWIFKGDYNTILDPDLRARLKKAELDASRKAA